MVRPLNQFCCGCTLSFGVKLVVALNLIQNVFYIATTTSNIILKIPTFGFNVDLSTQTANAAFCLLGLPFIAGAIWGVVNRLETHIRLYLVYLMASFALDMMYILSFLVIEDACGSMPTVLKKHGSAFACGFMRIGSIAFILLITIVELYFIFTVWSFCEDLKAGGSGSGLPQLLGGQVPQDVGRKRYGQGDYNSNLFGPAGVGGAFNMNYGSFHSAGYGGSSRIFNGNFHETAYPPINKI